MGVQDLNFGFVQHVAHALLRSSGGRGMIAFLRSIMHGPWNFLPLLTCWTWRHNVALVRLVGVCGHGVAESTLALRLREEKRHGCMGGCLHGITENQ